MAAAVWSAPLLAEHDHSKMGGGKDRMEMMDKKLDLTDDQKAKIKALRESFRDEMKAMHEKHQAAVSAILSPDQKAKFDKMKDKMKDKRKDGKHGKDCDMECCKD